MPATLASLFAIQLALAAGLVVVTADLRVQRLLQERTYSAVIRALLRGASDADRLTVAEGTLNDLSLLGELHPWIKVIPKYADQLRRTSAEVLVLRARVHPGQATTTGD